MANLEVELGRALAEIRALETTAAVEGTTLKSAIAEAVYGLNSETTEVSVDTSVTGAKVGQLQKVRDLRTSLFGEDGSGGVFEAMELLLQKNALVE